MKRKNEARLHLVSEGAGIVGIDIAKKVHCAKIINSNGYELTRPIMIYNDLEGFKKIRPIRKCSEPHKEVQETYNALRFKDRLYKKKKFVLPETEKLCL